MRKNVIAIFILVITLTVSSSPPDEKIIEVEVCRELFVIEVLDSTMLKQLDNIVKHKYPCSSPNPRYFYVLNILEAGSDKYVIQMFLEFPETIEIGEHKGCFLFNNNQYIVRSGYCHALSITEEKKKLCFTKRGVEVDGFFYVGYPNEEFCSWTLLYDYNEGKLGVYGTEYTTPMPDRCSPFQAN